MYEKGQRVVIRTETGERVRIVEDIIMGEDGQKLKVRDPNTHLVEVVNPVEDNIVEHLED
jgi:hypothetical protein